MSNNMYAQAMGEAYERLEGLGYERGDGMELANHGPMGAEALSTLGFSDQVGSWVADYKRASPTMIRRGRGFDSIRPKSSRGGRRRWANSSAQAIGKNCLPASSPLSRGLLCWVSGVRACGPG